MNPTTHSDVQTQTPSLWSRLAWLPIPLLIVAIVVLKALDWQTAHESEILLMLFNFVFSTLASLLVVVLFGRSFLARGTPGMLLFGCGVLLWGAAGTVAPALLAHGVNVIISVHNILVCLSAFCQLAGAILLLKPRTAFREAGPPLVVAHVAGLGIVWLVAVLVLEGELPVFFVQGAGGTPLRYVVLGSATMMFAGAAALLWTINRRAPTVFVRWYGPALLLVATGLFGVMIESVHGGALSWTGRAAQFLGGAYMLMAALASVCESGAWKVTLSEALEKAREAERVSEERYRMLFETMTEGFALHEIVTDEEGRPCDYRFLEMNPAFERLTGLHRAGLIGKRVLEVMPGTESHWIDNYGKVALTGEPLHMENYSAALKRWYEVYAYRTEQGSFAVVFSDITERKQAEKALRESEERHRLLSDTMLQGVIHQDVNGQIIEMNPAAERILGKDREQFIGRSSVQEEHHTIHENGQPFPSLEHPSMVALRTGQPVRSVVMGVFNPKFGDYRWISIDAVPVFPPGETCPSEVYTVFEDITKRRRAEEALQETESRFRIMANAMPQLAWIARADGHIFWYNQRWYDYTGTTPEQMEGWGWQSVHDPVELPKVLERWQASIATGEPFDMTFPLRGSDGFFRSFLTRGFPLKDASGRVQQWFGTNTDVSELKRVEEALRDQSEAALRLSEQEFRSLAEAMPQIVWATRPDGWNIYFNQQWVDYTGMTMEESYGHGWNEPFHPEDKQRAWDAWQRATQQNERYSLECRLRRADGVYRWWLIRGEPMRGANGEILKWFGTCTDIEELKRAETLLHETNALLEQRVTERTAALRETMDYLDNLLNYANAPIIVWDSAFRITRFNHAFERLTGLNADEVISKPLEILFPDNSRDESMRLIENALSGERWEIVEIPILHTDGSIRTVLWNSANIHGRDNTTVVATIAQGQDITERKRAEEALRLTQESIDGAAEMVAWFTPVGSVHYVNDATCRILGYSRDELLRMTALDFSPGFTWEQYQEHWQEVRERKSFTLETTHRRKDGSEYPAEVLVNYVHYGGQEYIFAYGRDIIERKQAEEALKVSLHEKEVLLKEIHHRVKNNMQVISSLVSLQADGSKDETVREVLKDVTYRVRSMALVHEKLYQSESLSRIDFAEYAGSLLSYLWRAHGATAASVRLTLNLEPVSLPVDTAVPCGLILNELAGNALKHAFRGRSGGEVTVSLNNGEDGHISLRVSDNGVGLPAGLDWRETSSLGLHLVKLLTKQLGASVDVSGGDGTKFEVVFGSPT